MLDLSGELAEGRFQTLHPLHKLGILAQSFLRRLRRFEQIAEEVPVVLRSRRRYRAEGRGAGKAEKDGIGANKNTDRAQAHLHVTFAWGWWRGARPKDCRFGLCDFTLLIASKV
ncbi:MAG: hypothetical protein J0I31_10700 [Rhizobiales bacterium]|nr:hypothetical protein [Hyphomicrobiales bacterium]